MIRPFKPRQRNEVSAHVSSPFVKFHSARYLMLFVITNPFNRVIETFTSFHVIIPPEKLKYNETTVGL